MAFIPPRLNAPYGARSLLARWTAQLRVDTTGLNAPYGARSLLAWVKVGDWKEIKVSMHLMALGAFWPGTPRTWALSLTGLNAPYGARSLLAENVDLLMLRRLSLNAPYGARSLLAKVTRIVDWGYEGLNAPYGARSLLAQSGAGKLDLIVRLNAPYGARSLLAPLVFSPRLTCGFTCVCAAEQK